MTWFQVTLITTVTTLPLLSAISIVPMGDWEVIWNWEEQHCTNTSVVNNKTCHDAPTSTPRAFLTGINNNVIEFLDSANDNCGYYQRRGSSFTDLQSICNATLLIPGDSSLTATPYEYNNKLWIESTWRSNSNSSIVHAIIRNIFYGNQVSNISYCSSGNQNDCTYTNGLCGISHDGGNFFKFYDNNYRVCMGTPFQYKANIGQQSVTHTNMISKNGYIYIWQNRHILNGYSIGLCLYRINETLINDPTQWRGYNNITNKFDIININPYKSDFNESINICSINPTLSADFRWSWTYNTVIDMYLSIGFIESSGKILYSISKDMFNWSKPKLIIKVNNTDHKQFAFPALLDDTSKGYNFEYSGENPYLYMAKGMNGANRDIGRIKLKISQ